MCFSSFKISTVLLIFLINLLFHVECKLNFDYHSNEELEIILKGFEKSGKKVLNTKLYTIGNSSSETKPFPLWVLKLTATKQDQLGIPNVKLLGNMHGNEAGGREILLHFIEYLLDQYNNDLKVTWLLNNTVIHIIPTINPDGFADASNTCSGTMGREVPTKKVDLNRNFPDYFRPDDMLERAKESIAVSKWMENTKFILSAALHEGAMVANYPYDLNANGEPQEFFTPDNDVFRFLAKTYSDNHPVMHKGIKCSNTRAFEGGITNGADWYQFEGGMGDYNYNFHGCMEVTLELNCCKYPKKDELPKLWNDNKKSLLLYCMQANRGVTGTIVDYETKQPIEAKLKILGRDKIKLIDREADIFFKSFKKTGEFWRLLLPGVYSMQIEAPGYNTQIQSFTVKENKPFPELTKLTIFLINSSTPISTTPKTSIKASSSATTTKKPIEINDIVPNLTSRIGEQDEETQTYNTVEVAPLRSRCPNCNQCTLIFLVYLVIFTVLTK